MFIAILLIIVGLVILIIGAESLVRGSASIAKKAGISSIVIGLTVVAFGTSTPELVVNIYSAINGTTDIAIGNVVGSNIFNILVILGVASILYPLSVKQNTVWKEIPFALLAMVLLFTMGNDQLFDQTGFNSITRTDGFSLIAIFVIFMFYIFALSKSGEVAPESVSVYSWPVSSLLTGAGIGCLFFGGKILVENAVALAQLAGLSESLIGLTIVAAGTSMPELATSVVAAYPKHDDIAVGNIIGSNIFNVFWILGLTGTLMQMPFNPSTNIDILIGIGVTVMLFVFMFLGSKRKLDRWQGVMFVLMYIVYTIYLIQRG